MTQIRNPNNPVYFLSYNDSNTIQRFGKTRAAEQATTRNARVEQFSSVNSCINRALDLGIVVHPTMNIISIEYPSQDCYFLAYTNDNSVCHYGRNNTNQTTGTGQPNIEKFANKQEWIDRAAELNIIIDPAT